MSDKSDKTNNLQDFVLDEYNKQKVTVELLRNRYKLLFLFTNT